MATSPFSRPRNWVSPGLAETLQVLKLPARKPTDADRPPVTSTPGPKIKPLRGQLDLDGNETGAWRPGRHNGNAA